MIETSQLDHQGQLSRKMSKSFSTGSIFGVGNTKASCRQNSDNLSEPPTSHEHGDGRRESSVSSSMIKKSASPPTLIKDLSLSSTAIETSKRAKQPLDAADPTSHISIKPKIKSQSFETSLILMHKFLKERHLYALQANELNGEYKHRTVFLARNSSSASSYNPSGGNEFGFNLQTYGLLNSLTKLTEYICFINNVQARSSARRAGLTNGDILLAIDNIRIEQFKRFDDIVKHVKGKSELCLIIFPESTCKRVQYQLRIAQIEKCLAEKNELVRKLLGDEETIIKKYMHLLASELPETPTTRPLSNLMNENESSINNTNSEINNEHPMQSSLTLSTSFSSASSGTASTSLNANIIMDTSVFLSPISNHSPLPTATTVDIDNSVCSELLNNTKQTQHNNTDTLENSSILNANNIMSSIISSGLGSESSHSVSNSSSFSSSSTNNVVASNVTKQQLKTSSTPNDPINATSTYMVAAVSSMADSAYLTALENENSLVNSTRSSIRGGGGVTGTYIVKLIKSPNDDNNNNKSTASTTNNSNVSSSMSSLATSSLSNSAQNVASSSSSSGTSVSSSSATGGVVKSKSMAKKCLEKTNRLIRSASTSSMNLISRMNPLGMSSTNLNHNQNDVFESETTATKQEMKHSNSTVFIAKSKDDKNRYLADSNKENAQPKIIKVCFFCLLIFNFKRSSLTTPLMYTLGNPDISPFLRNLHYKECAQKECSFNINLHFC